MVQMSIIIPQSPRYHPKIACFICTQPTTGQQMHFFFWVNLRFPWAEPATFIATSIWSLPEGQDTTMILKYVRADACMCKLYEMFALFMIILFWIWGQFNLANAFYAGLIFFKIQNAECSDFASHFRLNIIWHLVRLVTATPSPSSLSTLPQGN